MKKKACIVVLGDIGRSPRMQYHAQSLLEENYSIDIIGYNETPVLEILSSSPNFVKIHGLTQFPEINLPSTLKYIFKSVWQSLTLLIALISIAKPNFILVQNPPGVPTLAVVWIYCLFSRCSYIVDWHNYTFSILAINKPRNKTNITVSLAKWIEKKFGAKSSANFCVTQAMKEDLSKNFNISATVLYDRAPMQFQPIDIKQKHQLFMHLSEKYPEFLPKDPREFEDGIVESTALTQKFSDGTVSYKPDRPAIIVSSTSWTEDEDFGVLLNALKEYEISTKHSNSYPSLLCVITGKGPQKEYYLDKISTMSFTKIKIITPWLESSDYPKILASADLGICLHWSSSGLDLPMKVVDMFGCGLPVCAINFKCLHELVVDGENGFIFENSNELAEQLKMWFENFPNSFTLINTNEIFTRNLREFQSLRWRENWKKVAFPIFQKFS